MRTIKFQVILHGSVFAYERINNGEWEFMIPELNPDKGERWVKGIIAGNYTRKQFTGFVDSLGNEIYDSAALFVTAGYVSRVEFQDGAFVSVYNHSEDGETLPLSEVIGTDTEVVFNVEVNEDEL